MRGRAGGRAGEADQGVGIGVEGLGAGKVTACPNAATVVASMPMPVLSGCPSSRLAVKTPRVVPVMPAELAACCAVSRERQLTDGGTVVVLTFHTADCPAWSAR